MAHLVFIAEGNLVAHDGTTYRIRRLSLDYKNVVCEHAVTRALKEIPLSELKEALAHIDVDNSTDAFPPIESFSEDQQRQAEYRFSIIKDLIDGPVDPERIKEAAEKHKIGKSTIYKWRSRYLKTGFTSSLIDREGRGGKGVWRLPDNVNEIIDECIQLYYLKGKKSVKKTMREIELLCQKKKCDVPNINTIKNRVRGLSEEEVARYRRGNKKSKELYQAKTGKIPGAEYPYAMVQIDHTRLDIVLVDEEYRMVLGRPWLTLLIDVCTRIPLGFYISLDPPGNFGTGQAIAMALFTKDKILAKYNLDSEWPVWGPIKILHCDNAGEFHSEMLKASCLEYGITLQYRKIATPHYGAHIERWLGTFAKEIHDLPGTTYSNTAERKFFDYDSEKYAAFTLGDIEEYLITFITKVYMQRIHSGLGMAPIARLKQFLVGSDDIPAIGIQPVYTDEDRVKLDFLPFVERTVQSYGVEIENFTYYSTVLSPFVNLKVDAEFSKKREKRRFIFKLDPNNLNRTYFLHPESKEYFQIPQSDLNAPPMSKWEKREVEKKLRAEGAQVNQDSIISGYTRLKEIEEAAQAITKKARRKKHRREVTESRTVNLMGTTPANEAPEQKKKIDYSILNSIELDHESFN